MGSVIVVGGGPIGLASAMLLAREGHDVTVLEKDPQGPPATALEAWRDWQRTGVAQFRQAHAMHARFRHLLDAEFPDIRDDIVASGGRRVSIMTGFLNQLEDRSPRPGDEKFETITARRPVVESAFARAAENTPGVKVIRGVSVAGPIAGKEIAAGIPHVVGVRTKDGRDYAGDLVVDALGRKSEFDDWAVGLGGGHRSRRNQTSVSRTTRVITNAVTVSSPSCGARPSRSKPRSKRSACLPTTKRGSSRSSACPATNR